MFDRLDDMLRHYEELMLELNNPSVAEDQRKFRKLMKEQADLAPIVDAYKQYKQAKQDVEDRRLCVVVVFATPPFWFAIAITFTFFSPFVI